MDYVIFNEDHHFYHEKKKKTQKILSFARFSDRREVTKINQAKRKSRSLPSLSAILEPGTG